MRQKWEGWAVWTAIPPTLSKRKGFLEGLRQNDLRRVPRSGSANSTGITTVPQNQSKFRIHSGNHAQFLPNSRKTLSKIPFPKPSERNSAQFYQLSKSQPLSFLYNGFSYLCSACAIIKTKKGVHKAHVFSACASPRCLPPSRTTRTGWRQGLETPTTVSATSVARTGAFSCQPFPGNYAGLMIRCFQQTFKHLRGALRSSKQLGELRADLRRSYM